MSIVESSRTESAKPILRYCIGLVLALSVMIFGARPVAGLGCGLALVCITQIVHRASFMLLSKRDKDDAFMLELIQMACVLIACPILLSIIWPFRLAMLLTAIAGSACLFYLFARGLFGVWKKIQARNTWVE